MGRLIVVNATWDPEASVWVAESDIPFVTEAPTIEALQAKLPNIIKDLLEEDGDDQYADVAYELVARKTDRVRVGIRRAA
ncbi:MAG: DUF1902 domain-containing protein [Variibacter sp.]|nr:DUF1902 domain-containing protein [Variibacter sp.]